MKEIKLELIHTILKTNTLVNSIAKSSMKTHEATMLQYRALNHLISEGEQTVSILAKTLKISISSATQLIERLENNSLISRIHDQNDRRKVNIKITDEGKKHHKYLFKCITSHINPIFKDLSEIQLQQLLEIKKIMLKNMQNKFESFNKHPKEIANCTDNK